MNECTYTPRQLAEKLGVSKETLRLWHLQGKLTATTTKGGHRRYCFKELSEITTKRRVIYARVSSRKQSEDLERQITLLKEAYPDFEVISDIGSGINFKRRGLQTILELAFRGCLQKVVVAHRDRLTRFGFELFDFIFKVHNVELEILSSNDIKEPARELLEDVLSIITVFTARFYGSRKYRILKKAKNLPEQRAKTVVSKVSRSIPLFLQQDKLIHQGTNVIKRKAIVKKRDSKIQDNEERQKPRRGRPRKMAS